MLIGIYHGKPEDTLKILEDEQEKVVAKSDPEPEKLDKEGFAALKAAMSNNPRIQIKG